MYISLKAKYINSFFKDQKDFYFQLEYLCRNHKFSLGYEMTVFKVSVSFVEPNLIIVTCVALNLCQNKAKITYRMSCIFIHITIDLE